VNLNLPKCKSVVYGALFVLMVTVWALVIALAVVATKSKNDKAGNGQGNPNSKGYQDVLVHLLSVD